MTDKELYELFHKYLAYNECAGSLTWKINRYKCSAGSPVGTMKRGGYRSVSFYGKFYQIHRVIWMMQTESWPNHVVDHINGNGSDNCWSNLRDVSQTVNLENQRWARSNNKSGYLGVTKHRGKFRATIGNDKKQIYIGLFDDANEAHKAYIEAKRRIHQGCTI